MMVKNIAFPAKELSSIKSNIENNGFFYTTRVSNEYNKYFKGDKVYSPLLTKEFRVESVTKLDNISQHPFYNELTKEQIDLLSKYGKMDLIKLVSVEIDKIAHYKEEIYKIAEKQNKGKVVRSWLFS